MTARASAFIAALALAFGAGAQDAPLRVPGKPVVAAAKATAAAGTFRDTAYPAASRLALRLAPPDAAAVAAPQDDSKRTRIGMRREVTAEARSPTAAAALQWIAAPGGGRTARLEVASPGARSLRLGLRISAMPAGGELRFAGSAAARPAPVMDAERVTAAMRSQGIVWTPVTEGDSQVVELWLPGPDGPAPRVEVESVSHIAAAASMRFKSAGIGAAQSCHENVACLARDDPAVAQAARAVARLLYTENGMSYLCTGTLINDGDASSQAPFLHTAAHCIGSEAAAASLETFWFFEAADCAGGALAAYRQLSGGATLLYANEATDTAIVRLRDPAPAGAWFAGWDATPVAPGTPLLALHHPAGDLKKAARGVSLDPSSNIVASWSRGSTEGGSSGSGAFTAWEGEYLLRGGLRGGTASCASSGRIGDSTNRDYYSRLDLDAGALRKTLALPGGPPRFEGLWWNPSEPGWGLSIAPAAQQRAFVTWYTYDAQGRPTWLAMPDASWTSLATLEGTVYRATGTGQGQPYDAARFSMTAVGSARLVFGPGDATFEAVIEGQATTAAIRRLDP